MEQSSGGGGEVAAKRPDLSLSGANAGEDFLSALPDDILVLILVRLDTITEAARTSVLSRRWRRTWALLPELKFRSAPDHRHIREILGLARLTVRSESLLEMDLFRVNGLQQLNVDAPLLNIFLLRYCLTRDQPQPIANISAPRLITLIWMDVYDPSYVHLGNLGQLQQLSPNVIVVYGNHHSGHNREILRFLQHFQVIHNLTIVLGYPQGDIGNFQYLMEDITRLPHVTFLTLLVMNEGHAFGASSFHVLRLCTGIRKLSLILLPRCNSETQSTCPSGCICDESANWKIESLSLNCLREVEITDLSGAECEVAFLKQLFKWAGVLEKLRITFDYSVSKSKAKEVCQRLSSISRPETLIEFCMYRNSGRGYMDFLSLKDEGTRADCHWLCIPVET
ncbi:hypothetical protein EJB05_13870, partial [Eragrostis curvula]